MPTEYRVDEKHADLRIDAFLALCLPNLGLRGRRRAIAGGLVLVNGKKPAFSRRLAAGDVVSLYAYEEIDDPGSRAGDAGHNPESGVRLLFGEGDIFLFYKPPFLHSESLAGSGTPSLAHAIHDLCEKRGIRPLPLLVQRLDYETSGLVCALSESCIPVFRHDEREGRVKKLYLALLKGVLPRECTVTLALDTDKRRKTRVLRTPCQPFRQTIVRPLAYGEPGEHPPWLDPQVSADVPLTLALCVLFSGARHQIRAHAASLGHPLYGDALYGTQCRTGRFYLHAAGLLYRDISFFERPPWLSPSAPWDTWCGLFRSLS